MAVNPELTYFALNDPIDLRLAQAASIPEGYRSIPDYTVKIVEQGVQFILEFDGSVYDNETLTDAVDAVAVSQEGIAVAVAVQSRDGQVRVIPSGTPLSSENLQEGDRIYFPQRQQELSQSPQLHQSLPPQTVSELETTDKLIEAMKLSVHKVDDKFVESMQAFLQPETLAIMGGVMAVWGASHLVGVGQAADVALLGAGALALGADIGIAASHLWNYFDQAQKAQTPEQLEQAADYFAEFVNLVGVNALGALVGAKVGKVTDDLAKVVKNNWGKVAELGADAQRSVGSLLKSGGQLLDGFIPHVDDVVTDAQRLFSQGVNDIKQLGKQLGITPPEPELAGIGRLDDVEITPQKPMQMQGGTSPSSSVLGKLQQQGISDASINSLAQRGVPPQQLEQTVNTLLSGGRQADEIPDLVKTLDALVEGGLDLTNAEKILTSRREVVETAKTLMLGKGELDNPEGLSEIASKIIDQTEYPSGQEDLIRELRIAAERVQNGSRVQLGTVKDPSITPELMDQINESRRLNPSLKGPLKSEDFGRGADVVDLTKKETIHVKNIHGDSAETALAHLKKASIQHRGLNGEIPYEGFKKVTELRVRPNNELFQQNGQKINDGILDRVRNGELKDFDGSIRIVKEDAQGIPTQTLEFRIKNGRSQFSSQQKHSSLETDRTVAKAELEQPVSGGPAISQYTKLAQTIHLEGATATPDIAVAAYNSFY